MWLWLSCVCYIICTETRAPNQTGHLQKTEVSYHWAFTEAVDRSAIPPADLSTMSVGKLKFLYHSELLCILDTLASPSPSPRSWVLHWWNQTGQTYALPQRRSWRKSGLTVHRQIFMKRKQTINNLLWNAKCNHYTQPLLRSTRVTPSNNFAS